jgi:hypothetical protein
MYHNHLEALDALGTKLWAFPPKLVDPKVDLEFAPDALSLLGVARSHDRPLRLFYAVEGPPHIWMSAAPNARDIRRLFPHTAAPVQQLAEHIHKFHVFPSTHLSAYVRAGSGYAKRVVRGTGSLRSLIIMECLPKRPHDQPQVLLHKPAAPYDNQFTKDHDVAISPDPDMEDRYVLHCLMNDRNRVCAELLLPERNFGQGGGLIRGGTFHRTFEVDDRLLRDCVNTYGPLPELASIESLREHLDKHLRTFDFWAQFPLAHFEKATSMHLTELARMQGSPGLVEVTLRTSFRPKDDRWHRSDGQVEMEVDQEAMVNNSIQQLSILMEEYIQSADGLSELGKGKWLKGLSVWNVNRCTLEIDEALMNCLKMRDSIQHATVYQMWERFVLTERQQGPLHTGQTPPCPFRQRPRLQCTLSHLIHLWAGELP